MICRRCHYTKPYTNDYKYLATWRCPHCGCVNAIPKAGRTV